jgi:hypothetical protein
VGLTLLSAYMELVRALQKRYFLEPAGSRGVWGLDDYHFLVFLFGSAQLCGHKHLRPRSVRDESTLDLLGHEYLYLAAIRHVRDVKVCSFAEHSPMLHDITGVKSWEKVNAGLLSMYQREVLSKHAVVQHFLFSSFLPRDEEQPEALAAVLAALPVTQADLKPAPAAAGAASPVPPCCSDAIRFPAAAGARSGAAPVPTPKDAAECCADHGREHEREREHEHEHERE